MSPWLAPIESEDQDSLPDIQNDIHAVLRIRKFLICLLPLEVEDKPEVRACWRLLRDAQISRSDIDPELFQIALEAAKHLGYSPEPLIETKTIEPAKRADVKAPARANSKK